MRDEAGRGNRTWGRLREDETWPTAVERLGSRLAACRAIHLASLIPNASTLIVLKHRSGLGVHGDAVGHLGQGV